MAIGFASYEIARSGLFVSERGLFVTGHNISNVNTSGYVRQRAEIADSRYQTTYGQNGLLQVGLGADIQKIRQIRDQFLDAIYRHENTVLGYWEARDKTFQDVQAILGEPMEAGLQDALNNFYDAWQELSKDPGSLTVRALVRQRGEVLVQYINSVGEQLDRLQNNLNSEIKTCIDEINEITGQIAKLNVTISTAELTGDNANDYRDQRNALVDRLSKLADVQVYEAEDGQLDITLGGYLLVTKNIQKKLYAGESNPGSSFYVPKLEGTDIEVPVKSGTLKGLMESRGTADPELSSETDIVSGLKKKLNYLIRTLVEEVNKLHKSGKTLGNPPSDGEDFFVAINPGRPIGLGNIKLNDNLNDLNNIVASESGESGDNVIALRIANLRHVPLISDASGLLSLDEYYQSIIQDIGNGGAEAAGIYESQYKLVQSTDAARQALSGVSMDEEMANMMKFKFAYNAAARVMNIIDQMTETVVARMGLVGR